MRDPLDNETHTLALEGPQRIGYARVSTDDQRLDLQRDALTKADCVQVYADMASGKNTERPELTHCLKALRPGDTLVVWRLDRLGRSLADLVRTIDALQRDNIGFESLTEKIDTTSAGGTLIFHIFGALAQFERALIAERTKAGLAAARARGRHGGRRAKLDSKAVRQIRTLLNDRDISVQSVADRFGVSRATIYRTLNRADAASGQTRRKPP